MCRVILIILAVVFVLFLVVVAVVMKEFGWPGFFIFLGSLFLLALIGRLMMPRFFAYIVMRPLRDMGRVMQGATLVVHSIAPTEAPVEPEFPEENHDSPAIEDVDDEDDIPEEDEEPPPPELDWYLVEFTVVPPGNQEMEGRIAHRAAWSPSLLSASITPRDGRPSNSYRVWQSDFDLSAVQNMPVEMVDRDPEGEIAEQIFGPRRLRMQIGVARHVTAVAVQYATFTPVGEIAIPPRINIQPESTP